MVWYSMVWLVHGAIASGALTKPISQEVLATQMHQQCLIPKAMCHYTANYKSKSRFNKLKGLGIPELALDIN